MMFKPSAQTRYLVESIGLFKEKVVKEFEALWLFQAKVDGIESIYAWLDGLDAKFEEQVTWLAQVQKKVDLSVSSIGKIHHEQVQVPCVLKQSTSVKDADLARLAAEEFLGSSPVMESEHRDTSPVFVSFIISNPTSFTSGFRLTLHSPYIVELIVLWLLSPYNNCLGSPLIFCIG